LTQILRTHAVSLLVIACLACSVPAHAAGGTRTTVVNNKVTAVGNSVTIVSSRGTTIVKQSNSCTAGVTGFLYQSIVVLFGGATYSVTQSSSCS
jgi:hypothetical protein